MKRCSYCGREYPDTATACAIDQQPLVEAGRRKAGWLFWRVPQLPLSESEQRWIEASLQWLLQQFGTEYFLARKTILPQGSFFPDPYRGTPECVDKLVLRVCSYMDVNPDSVEVEVFSDHDDEIVATHRLGASEYSGAAGLYVSQPEAGARKTIAINHSELKEPTSLVATIAHELGHVILLGGGRISTERAEHEYLTDLLTVFLGMGIFTANAAFQFSQWQDSGYHGWRASRKGYMSEEMFAYALAACAWMKGDPASWRQYLAMNVGQHFKSSLNYLEKGGQTALVRLPRPGKSE